MTNPADYVLQKSRAMHNAAMKRGWFSALPEETQETLLEIKRAYASGKYEGISLSAVSRSVIAFMKENSWQAPKHAGTIQRWLHSSDT